MLFDELKVAMIAGLSSFVLTATSAFALSKIFKKIGHLGTDVHKPCKIEVPESVGLALAIGISTSMLLVYAMTKNERALVTAFSVLLATIIGLIDDFKTLPAYVKIASGVIPALPVVLLEAYTPRPLIPLNGFARLTIIYPLLVFLAYTVSTNGFNMYDAYNGVMLSTALISMTAMSFIALMQVSVGIEESSFGFLASVVVLATVLALLPLNFYPATAFNGDTGSFALGAAYASIAIMGRLEAAAVLLALPIGLNGFLKITNVGFRERRSFERPVEIEGWLIKVKRASRAVSIYTLILSRTPLSEPEILAVSVLLTGLSSVLALITMYITLVELS
ncbi:MAG: hypothetical protein QXN05_02210 [Acidilobaceae archaeon]